jgi:uncharacterized membrane protein
MKVTVREIAIAGVLSAVAVLLAVTQLGFIPFFAGISITIMHVPVIIGAIVAGPVVGTLIGLIFGVSSLILAAVAPRSPADVFFTDPWVSVLPRLFIGLAAWGAYLLARRMGKKPVLVVGGVALAAIVLAVAYTVARQGITQVLEPLSVDSASGVADAIRWPLIRALSLEAVGLALVAWIMQRVAPFGPEELAISLGAVAGTLTNTLLVLTALTARGYIPGELALTVGVTNGPAEMVGATVVTVAVVAAWRQVALRRSGSSV